MPTKRKGYPLEHCRAACFSLTMDPWPRETSVSSGPMCNTSTKPRVIGPVGDSVDQQGVGDCTIHTVHSARHSPLMICGIVTDGHDI